MAIKNEKNNLLIWSTGSAAHRHTSSNSYGGSWQDPVYTTTGTGISKTTTWPISGTTTFPAAPIRCIEHEIEGEVEMLDGSIVGTCMRCGETIKGRRLAGGLGLEQFKMVLAGDIDGEGVLAEAILRLQEAIDAERKALEDAVALLRLAEAMLVHQAAA